MQERVWCVCGGGIVKEWWVYMVFEREVWCGSDMAKDVLSYLSYALFGVCLLCCGGCLGGPVMAPPALICWMLQSRRSSDDNVIRLDHSHHAPCTLTSLLVSWTRISFPLWQEAGGRWEAGEGWEVGGKQLPGAFPEYPSVPVSLQVSPWLPWQLHH